MSIKQAIKKFRTDDIAVNVQTKQEWVEFLELLEAHSDMVWGFDTTPTRFMKWGTYEEDSCIVFVDSLYYSPKAHYIEQGFEIITFQDFKKLYNLDEPFEVGSKWVAKCEITASNDVNNVEYICQGSVCRVSEAHKTAVRLNIGCWLRREEALLLLEPYTEPLREMTAEQIAKEFNVKVVG